MAQFQDKSLESQEDILRTNYLNEEEENINNDEWVNFATLPIVEEGIWTDEYEGGDDDDEEDDDDDDYDDFSDDDDEDDLLGVDDDEEEDEDIAG